MNNAAVMRLRQWWAALDHRNRRRYAVAAMLLAYIGAIAVCIWLRAEHSHLSVRENQAIGQLNSLQDQLAEVKRLKGQVAPPPLKGPALQAAVAASLQSRSLPLTVAVIDRERLRVQGNADFDDVMRWLGSVQQSQRLNVASLSASRQDSVAKFDLILAATSE